MEIVGRRSIFLMGLKLKNLTEKFASLFHSFLVWIFWSIFTQFSFALQQGEFLANVPWDESSKDGVDHRLPGKKVLQPLPLPNQYPRRLQGSYCHLKQLLLRFLQRPSSLGSFILWRVKELRRQNVSQTFQSWTWDAATSRYEESQSVVGGGDTCHTVTLARMERNHTGHAWTDQFPEIRPRRAQR